MDYWYIYAHICVKKKTNLVIYEEGCRGVTMLKCERKIEKSGKCFLKKTRGFS